MTKMKMYGSEKEAEEVRREHVTDFASLAPKLMKAVGSVLSDPKYKCAIVVVMEKLPEGLQDAAGLEKRAIHLVSLGDIEDADIPAMLVGASKMKMD